MSNTAAVPTLSPYSTITWKIAIAFGALLVAGLLIWQAITSHGNPDPLADGISPTAAVLNTGVLVFREGLEAILVLAALTASLARTEEGYWKPVAIGAGLSFIATVVTWFVVVGVLATLDATLNIPALKIQ